MTNNEIIRLQQAGELEKAFNGIVETYTERLYWHVRRFLCSHEDTNDLLQDIFIKIWRSLSSFRGESQLYTWVYRIATNETLNHLRKQRRNSIIEMCSLSDIMAQRIDDDPYFNGNEMQRELHKAIQRLPEKQRLVFNMRYFDDLKYEDIAEITGTSVGALKASYHHACTKIKTDMENIFL
ncbi:MAG: RNA polymerase sigma factor [Bacteroidales bacterium]|nr:RNA polymerase sigma factor [Bacteroidales bacterium]MBQ6689282.1 RNA polymerase sigma factor [Bacteroidales bacterium]